MVMTEMAESPCDADFTLPAVHTHKKCAQFSLTQLLELEHGNPWFSEIAPLLTKLSRWTSNAWQVNKLSKERRNYGKMCYVQQTFPQVVTWIFQTFLRTLNSCEDLFLGALQSRSGNSGLRLDHSLQPHRTVFPFKIIALATSQLLRLAQIINAENILLRDAHHWPQFPHFMNCICFSTVRSVDKSNYNFKYVSSE